MDSVRQLTTLDLLDRIAKVNGVRTVELNYPQHFNGLKVNELRQRLEANGLRVQGLALRYEAPEYVAGAFTNPDSVLRSRAIDLARQAVDTCLHLGGDTVTLWLAYDGFDYPFQVDYRQLWDLELQGIAEVALYNPQVRISVEYKPADPRTFSLLGDIGTTLLAIDELNRPNVGVTLDFCHMLMAGERPAYSATLAHRSGRLFGIHLNDGYGHRDDGLSVAHVHPFETLELLRLLREWQYEGVLYFDTFPEREDPIAECEQNIAMVEELTRIIEAIPRERLDQVQNSQDALGITSIIQASLTIASSHRAPGKGEAAS